MAMLDSLKGALNKGVATVSAKSETLVESSRIKSAISGAQRKVEAEKAALGAKLYQCWKAGEIDLGSFEGDFARIRDVEDQIDQLNDRLAQLKVEEEEKILSSAQPSPTPAAAAPSTPPAPPAEGSITCAKCGRVLPAGSRFCDQCGNMVGD